MLPWAGARRDAERAARNAPGVLEVDNRITVDPGVYAAVYAAERRDRYGTAALRRLIPLEDAMKLTKPAPTTIVREDFENLFDRFFGRGITGAPARVFETTWMPSLDFSEDEKNYVIRVEAPGIPKDDLEVNLDGQILTISGRRTFEQEEQNEEYFWREREQGRFVRTVRLPAPVTAAKIEATYNDGVMTVRLPKAEGGAKSRIVIK